MRLLLILIIIAAIFAFVRTQWGPCSWEQEDWFRCVIGLSAPETPAPAPAMPEPPAAPEPSAPEPPAPETPAPETPAPETPAAPETPNP